MRITDARCIRVATAPSIDPTSLAVVLFRPDDVPATGGPATGGAGFGRAGSGCCRPREGRRSHPGVFAPRHGARAALGVSRSASPGSEESGNRLKGDTCIDG